MPENLPIALLDSLEHVKGFNRKSFEDVHNNPAQVTSVRLNPLKQFDIEGSVLSIQQNIPWCVYGRYLNKRPFFTFDPLLHAGAYYVQDASSMFLWQVLEQTVGKNTNGLRVLDLCAAPGGKSTLLASYFNDGLLVANEVIKSRANTLVENITKWGTENTIVTCNDPSHFARLENYFDVIVIDAPCSGSGLFRRDAGAINEWSLDNVALCSQRQQRILADVYPALKQGGIIIYSTCSYSREEDEDILLWINKHLDVTGYRIKLDEDWGIVETEAGNGNFGYRFYPDKLMGEGFFITAFQKKDGGSFYNYTLPLAQAPKHETDISENWIKNNEALFYFKQNENIIAIPEQWKQDAALLQKNLYLRKVGITVGAVKGKDLVPNHELALSMLMNENIQTVDASLEEALLYLKKKEIILENRTKGWAVITYKQLALGWVKVLHNRVNNYYPMEWRILKD
ncbi:MAG TPA: RNA methyltransferase [Panacibacter sp.]|nr:RNA methyltransferase [Panacibacter sp.]